VLEHVRQTLPWFIAIGASGAAGLADIKELLADLPDSLQAVVLVVLHRPWGRQSHLRSVLAHGSTLPLAIAGDGEHLDLGTVYIGRPDQHLTLAEDGLGELISDPVRRYRNRTIDLLFHSVAVNGGKRILGVILSGSLDDGSRGLEMIHNAGGHTMALARRNTGQFPGMPENAANYDGAIDLIGSVKEIAAGISAAVQNDENRTDDVNEPSSRVPSAISR
jgi:two-component system chemotaxis response regulator CheB